MYLCHFGPSKLPRNWKPHTHTLRLPRPHSWLETRTPFLYHPSQQGTMNVVKINISLQKQEFCWLDHTTRGYPYTSHVQTCQLFEKIRAKGIQFLYSLTPPSTDTWRTCLFSPSCGSIIDWLFVSVQRNYGAVAVPADRTTRGFYWSFVLANSTLSCLKRGHQVDAENKLQITNYKPKYSLEIREHLIRNMHFSS